MRLGRGRFAHGEPAKPVNPWRSLMRVLPWLAPYWPVMLFGFTCMLVMTYLGVQPPRIIRQIIDHTIPFATAHHSLEPIIQPLVLLLGLFVATALFRFLRTYFLHVAGQRVLHELRGRLYDHFQRLPLTYYDNKQTGDLMSRMTSDVEQIEHIMVHGLDLFLNGFFMMALVGYYIGSTHLLLLGVALIPIPILFVSIFFFSRAVRLIYRKVRDRVGDLNAMLQDNLSGIRVIKAFTREPTELARVTEASAQVLDTNVRGIRMWSSFGPLMEFVGQLGKLAVITGGVILIIQGHLEVGALVACILWLNDFYSPIGTLFQFFDSIQRSLAAGERILEVLDTVPSIQDPVAPLALEQVRGEVTFDGVSFQYETGDEVLRDLHLTAEPGQRIALVGRSGAGKTSFINLIPRFYDAVEGAVLVDGIDVRDVRQADLRKHIALVLQETFLFNGTVAQNLRYGKEDATAEELIAASEIANAHEFIARLPKGYDTEIGERGVKLSGGQKQRLAIARAVLADPRILVLDEATSSVDSESEFLIHQALDRLMEGRTTFIIAHRLSTIRNADVILVLENGSIVERGSHTALLRTGGLYAQMYKQQFWLDELYEDEEAAEAEVEPPLPVLE